MKQTKVPKQSILCALQSEIKYLCQIEDELDKKKRELTLLKKKYDKARKTIALLKTKSKSNLPTCH